MDVLRVHHRGRAIGRTGEPVGRGSVRRTGDDQRVRASSIRNGVDLVDDRVVVAALHQLVERPRHVVAQVVEAELVVGAVGDVGGVGGATLVVSQAGDDHPDVQPEEPVHAAHPLAVAFGQVVVDRDDVDALAAQGVEVGRAASRQVRVLPSPVFISATLPKCSAAPPITWTSKCRWPSTRHAASRATANASGSRSSSLAPSSMRARNSAVLASTRRRRALGLVGQGIDVVSDPLESLDRASFRGAATSTAQLFPCGLEV